MLGDVEPRLCGDCKKVHSVKIRDVDGCIELLARDRELYLYHWEIERDGCERYFAILLKLIKIAQEEGASHDGAYWLNLVNRLLYESNSSK